MKRKCVCLWGTASGWTTLLFIYSTKIKFVLATVIKIGTLDLLCKIQTYWWAVYSRLLF